MYLFAECTIGLLRDRAAGRPVLSKLLSLLVNLTGRWWLTRGGETAGAR